MRVLMIVAGYPTPERPDRGIFNARTAKALKKQIEVDVLFCRSWWPGRSLCDSTVVDDVRLVTVTAPYLPTCNGLNSELFSRVVQRYLARYISGFDVIHSIDIGLPARLGCLLSERFKLPHVVQVVSMMSFDNAADCRYLITHSGAIDLVICNSDALRKEFAMRVTISKEMVTLRRGVDLEMFRPQHASTTELTVPKVPTRFLYLGGVPKYRQRNIKGEETLMAAWRSVESALAISGAELRFAGPGSDSDTARAWRKTLQFPDRVKLIGAVPPLNIPKLMSDADAVIIPSTSEGLPNVAMEAGATGRAVLASNLPVIKEVVLEGETGWLFEPGSVDSLAQTLLRATSQKDLLRSMGIKARSHIERHFSLESYATRLVELYQRASHLRATLVSA